MVPILAAVPVGSHDYTPLSMEPSNHASAWTREGDLDGLERRIHDAAPLDELPARARAAPAHWQGRGSR